MSTLSGFQSKDNLVAAKQYAERGWSLVEVKAGGKKAVKSGWQNATPDPTAFAAFNVGVKLGNGLIDLDLDCPQAIQLVDSFFPELAATAFGRGPGVWGHRLVMCDDVPDNRATVNKYEFNSAAEKDVPTLLGLPKSVVLEVRAGKCYTVFPPSWYGEDDVNLKWKAGDLPADIPSLPWAEIERRAGLLAFASVVLAAYPGEGGRDDFCLKLAGALLAAGFDADKGAAFIEMIATAAGDEEAGDRPAKMHATIAKKESGEPVNGLPGFLAHIGAEGAEKKLRKWLGMASKTAEGRKLRPSDDIPPGAIKLDGEGKVERVDAMVALLLADDNVGGVYLRGNTLVRFTPEGDLTEVTPPWLAHRLQEIGGRFFRTDKYGINYLTDCGEASVQPLIATTDQRDFRRITGVVHLPTLSRNEPGWDEVTGLYLAFDEKYDVPMEPTRDQAVAALDLLLELFAYFPFTRLDSEPDDPVPLPPASRQNLKLPRARRSVALSGMLSAAIRGDLDTCPVHVTDAPAFGSGKTKIAQCWMLIGTGKIPDFSTWSTREDENTKQLTALLASGSPGVLFDNVEHELRGASLNAAITSPTWKTRVLGYNNRHMIVSTKALIAFSGSNIEVHSDMVRRTLVSRFDHGVANPDDLVFPFDPVRLVEGDMVKYRSACLTIMRAYKAAGCPGLGDLPSDGSFASWRIVRGALVWLGQADPWATVEDTRRADPDVLDKIQLCKAIIDSVGLDRPFNAYELDAVNDNDCGDITKMPIQPKARILAILDTKEWSNKSVGRLLTRYRDQVVYGMRLKRKGDGGKWILTGEPDPAFKEMTE